MTNKDAIEALDRIYKWACPAKDMPYSTPLMVEDIETIRKALENQITVEWLEGQKLTEFDYNCTVECAMAGGFNAAIDKMISKVKGE